MTTLLVMLFILGYCLIGGLISSLILRRAILASGCTDCGEYIKKCRKEDPKTDILERIIAGGIAYTSGWPIVVGVQLCMSTQLLPTQTGKTKVNHTLTELKKDGKVYVAEYIPLNILSQGDTEIEALSNLAETIAAFYVSSYERGTFDKILEAEANANDSM